MKKLLSYFLLVISLSVVFVKFANAADGNPVDVLQSIADRMIENLKANKESLQQNPAKSYDIAYKILVPHADVMEMAKRVLPPQTWNDASPAQRTKFESEFTQLLVRTYASALADYTNQTIEFYPVRGGYQGKSTVTVASQIKRADGPPIAVNYSLVSKGSEWKVYDMTVEGISLLESFRSQFADKLSQGNIENLIAELEKHNASHSGS